MIKSTLAQHREGLKRTIADATRDIKQQQLFIEEEEARLFTATDFKGAGCTNAELVKLFFRTLVADSDVIQQAKVAIARAEKTRSDAEIELSTINFTQREQQLEAIRELNKHLSTLFPTVDKMAVATYDFDQGTLRLEQAVARLTHGPS